MDCSETISHPREVSRLPHRYRLGFKQYGDGETDSAAVQFRKWIAQILCLAQGYEGNNAGIILLQLERAIEHHFSAYMSWLLTFLSNSGLSALPIFLNIQFKRPSAQNPWLMSTLISVKWTSRSLLWVFQEPTIGNTRSLHNQCLCRPYIIIIIIICSTHYSWL